MGDFNGDLKPDVATANMKGNSNVTILLGDGAGGFGATSNLGLNGMPGVLIPNGVAVGDLNGN